MPLIKYDNVKLNKDALAVIAQANAILAEYAEHRISITLRTLYYQFVARGYIANNEKQYRRLGVIIANGRLAGMIDWSSINDMTRYLRKLPTWDSPEGILAACASDFRFDKWARQPEYVEVWVEKDALLGVIGAVCEDNATPYLSCRGFSSASEVWRAGHHRLRPRIEADKECSVLYLGDHDPSGLDMNRDLQERIDMFTGYPGRVHIDRIALNMDQVEIHQPPPNPTKMTDSRAAGYIDKFGYECWELDALNPLVIRNLIQTYINQHRDQASWDEAVAEEDAVKKNLASVATHWNAVVETLPSLKKKSKGT